MLSITRTPLIALCELALDAFADGSAVAQTRDLDFMTAEK